MAKLERVTAKVFASDAPADKIGQFGSALAGTKLETGDVSTIQALPAYTEGWSSAVISQRNYPVLQETNGVMKNMSYQTAYIMQNGIAEYDPDTEYYAGSICKGIGNTNQYASWGDENVGNDVTNSQYWKNVTPVNYSNITNCLLEVPQRIKLELNNGTLTLKAGTVAIVPNGFEADGVTPKFDYVTVESDSTIKNGSNKQEFILVENGNITGGVPSAWAYSGATQPTVSTTFALWYDSANNKIKLTINNGSTWTEGLSLPIALATSSTTQYTSIDQVFNGMGYIGSTVWLDKGIKCLIPNGRNEDGSLKNVEWTNDKIRTSSGLATGAFDLVYKLNTDVFEMNKPANWSFNEDKNIYVYKDGTEYTLITLGRINLDTGTIIAFNPKQPFRAVDYNDSSTVSGWGMPSDKYINLTLGASGSTYTAPANGWVTFCKRATAAAQEVELLTLPIGQNVRFRNTSASSNFLLMVSLPVRKGQQFMVGYTAGGETEQFTFIYAEGEV